MRLGFHYHTPAVVRDGSIKMPGYLGRFIDSLAEFCDEVICFLHSPSSQDTDRMTYRIVAENVSLINIGPHASVMERTLRSRSYTALLKKYADKLDVLLVRGPSPLLPAMVLSSPVPTAVMLVGDYVAGVDNLPQPRWRKEAIRVWSYWNKLGQDRAASQSLTFVNSRVLYEDLKPKLKNLYEIRTTTLTKEDFFVRADTCQSKPCRLLYVGRIDRAKGLLDMAEAVALLVERGEDVTLDLVGWEEKGDPVLLEINELAASRNVSDRIHYLGSRSLGPELFECYRKSDIYLLASRSNFEGFPRTIWEAMAQCLPVVATRVGSIPAFVEGAAELVRPGDVVALAGAIARLIHHPEDRRKLIERGLALARSNTLEAQVAPMVTKMQSWLETQND